jgi:hypothetical protein
MQVNLLLRLDPITMTCLLTTSFPDAQVSDKIKIDMTYLKDQNKIQPTYPEPDEDGIVRGRPHYKVEFDLFPIAEDRNLRYEARDIETGEVLKQGRISIAAAFSPGTF